MMDRIKRRGDNELSSAFEVPGGNDAALQVAFDDHGVSYLKAPCII
jgi:hypothetical protein